MISFLTLISASMDCEGPYRAVGLKHPHESQNKYTIFHLQNQPFLTNLRDLPFCIPALKDGVLERKIR